MGLTEELGAHVQQCSGTVAKSSAVISDIVARLAACFEHGGKLTSFAETAGAQPMLNISLQVRK